MSGQQNSEKVKLLISKLRKSIKTIVNIDDLLPILDEFYIFLTTESKQLPASKVKNFILKILYLFKSAIKANKFIDDNETKTIFKHKLCKIISFYIDVELFSVGIGKDSSDNITNRISTTIDSYFNEPENILKIFRASLQIRKGKQIMRFRDIVIALFTKYFYRQARAQPLIIDDVLFLEQLSLYKIWSSLLDSQAHKDELIEMVVNYMVPLNKQILMSQLGITNADNFIEEALKTTPQQVIEKAIINNTDIIDLDPEINDSYVSLNINETLLNDLEHEQTIDKVCKPISWLDDLSMETTVKLIEKRVIIEIDDDEDDDVMEIVEPSKIDAVDDVVIDLNVVKNLSLDDEVVDPQKHEIISEVCVNDEEFEDKVQINEEEEKEEIKVQINEIEKEEREKVQTNENFLKSDILRTYSRKEKSDIAYRTSIDTMEIGTMTDLSAHTKETEMCIENEMSSTEPDMSQREIDNHLASSPLKIVKSFTCPPPSIPKLFELNLLRSQPESVPSKICIMERKTYIREEETPVYGTGSFNNRSRYDVKSLKHPQFNNSLELLQYEVSPRRNRIDVVIGSVKKRKIKSVRFADEEVTRNKTPMETHYGTTVDSITALDNYLKKAKLKESNKVCHSFVLLERNITCERMAARKTSIQHKKCLKLPENWENIKTKYVNTGNSPYEPYIDERIFDDISSNSEHSYNSEESDDSDSVDEEFESYKSVDEKTIESIEETDPNETKMLCYVLDNNTDGMEVDEDLYDKAQIMLENYRADCKDPVENDTKTSSEDEELNADKRVAHHDTDIITDTVECVEETNPNETEMLCYVLSSNEEIDVDELSNLYENESLEQITQTTSLPQSPITVDGELLKTGSESISINSEQITGAHDGVSEDEELNSDTDADHQENSNTEILGIVENIESNPSEMLCFVPESSPERMIVDDDELKNLYNKTHQSLDNQEQQEHKSDDEEFSQTESQSINSNSDLMTQSISENTSLNFEQISDSEDEISEDEEFNLDKIVDHNGNSKIEMLDSKEKTESSAGELLCYGLDSNPEKMIVDDDELSNLYNKTHPSLENQEHPGQSTMEEEFSQTESQSTNSHSDLITQNVSESLGFEQISATDDDISKDEDTIVEFLDDTSDSESEKSLISVYQLNDEYDETASQLSQKLDETVEELEEYKISVEQLTEDCKIVSIVRMDEEVDDAMEQLSSECDIPVERINDEMTNDLYHEEHLQEMKQNCDKNDYIHDNNNIAGFRAIEMNNYQKTSKHNSYNPATGDYIEAYVNYVKSETIPATNQDLLLPFDFVMSPPSTPDSTSEPKKAVVIKKRGRPKGSKNRIRPFVRTVPPVVVESPRIHPQYPINMKTYSKATTNNLYKATF